MFWDSVIGGLAVLTFWETYVAGFGYFLFVMGPIVLMSLATKEGSAAGCLSLFVPPVLQAAAIAVFVLTLAPIIFGFNEDAAWSFPWLIIGSEPVMFLKLVGTLVVATIVVALVPFFGQLQSLRTLVLGGIALVFVLHILRSVNPDFVSDKLDIIPGFWFTVGLLIIGALVTFVGFIVATFLASVMGGGNAEGTGSILIASVVAMFGFIPVFMYGAWIGNQLRHGF